MVKKSKKNVFLNKFRFLDIIFFIYLYQRYIYPVDRTRMNEFGTTGETDSALVPVNTDAGIDSHNNSSQLEQSKSDTTNEQHEKME
jgi:hypothetical protein